ncbi:hypothetical protein QN277_024323 [Acacia crassicarpa]|uniref:Integrase catalytic domain-containing protein n=1 Tax=Acacia crassicarpa TaxID=499986 RepID=A0AAE1JEJ0_9FABA|nr:hypothetical protein QN277_024323 [Acacia crassicarpa]
MADDAKEDVRRCDSCQKHARIIWPPPTELKGISAPWLFFKWGIDILEPFKALPGQFRWLIVAVDYFTKWIEAEPLMTITAACIMRFFRHNIVSRFGIPAEIVTNNETQFMDQRFQTMMSDLDVSSTLPLSSIHNLTVRPRPPTKSSLMALKNRCKMRSLTGSNNYTVSYGGRK